MPSMMREAAFTTTPPPGDYILNPGGLTWHIRRATDRASVLSISVSDKTRKTALARLLSLAEADATDAWENEGGSYRLVKRYRPSPRR